MPYGITNCVFMKYYVPIMHLNKILQNMLHKELTDYIYLITKCLSKCF